MEKTTQEKLADLVSKSTTSVELSTALDQLAKDIQDDPTPAAPADPATHADAVAIKESIDKLIAALDAAPEAPAEPVV